MRVTHWPRLRPAPCTWATRARSSSTGWMARQRGWRIVLRIEDLDGPRVKRGRGPRGDGRPALAGDRLGRGADLSIESARQSTNRRRNDCWPRALPTRASARGARSSRRPAPRTPRTARPSTRGRAEGDSSPSTRRARHAGREPAVRFAVPDEAVEFVDGFARIAPRSIRPENWGISSSSRPTARRRTSSRSWSTTRRSGVTDVVRGDDLIDSTPRQILLYDALECADRVPAYWHLPLVVGPDGRRLAKRHGDTRLAIYRERGVPRGARGRAAGAMERDRLRRTRRRQASSYRALTWDGCRSNRSSSPRRTTPGCVKVPRDVRLSRLIRGPRFSSKLSRLERVVGTVRAAGDERHGARGWAGAAPRGIVGAFAGLRDADAGAEQAVRPGLGRPAASPAGRQRRERDDRRDGQDARRPLVVRAASRRGDPARGAHARVQGRARRARRRAGDARRPIESRRRHARRRAGGAEPLRRWTIRPSRSSGRRRARDGRRVPTPATRARLRPRPDRRL